MDGLIPVDCSLGIGVHLGWGPEIKTSPLSFGSGYAIIAVSVYKRGIDILSTAINDNGILGQAESCTCRDDRAIPDDERGICQRGLSVLYDSGIRESVAAFARIGDAVDRESNLCFGEECL